MASIIVVILAAMALSSCTAPSPWTDPDRAGEFEINRRVLESVRRMPEGGGYSTRAPAFDGLLRAVNGVRPEGGLQLHLKAAQPSFCSEACYLVLLDMLNREASAGRLRLSPEAWAALVPYPKQEDGDGIWGRANANGPGWAVLMRELGAGYNFEDISKACPGDVMKIFWTNEIGRYERGHLVVFLGISINEANGESSVSFWSSNMNEGYGVKSVPLSRVKRMIFTRLTDLGAFEKAASLPHRDPWLHGLLRAKVSPADMGKRI